ncbi:MAG: Teichoic acid translocation permease TagG [Bacillales bacterium]|jgi:teichoic acid transport system permease protein|nr:Teichoic acid translocation permease TagG [Bacillales bacterium]
MKSTFLVLVEQIKARNLIIRLAAYDIKSLYGQHYLGIFWQILSPMIQISAYWLVFGVGFRNGAPVNGIPFLSWMLCGMIPWFFISPTILEGSNSVYKRIGLVAKMNFPISTLPSVAIVTNLIPFFVMYFFLIIKLITDEIYPNFYWIYMIYYLFCMVTFMFSLSLFNSTISVIFRDYQQLLQAVTRLLFFISPIFWSPSSFSNSVLAVLQFNPIYYIIEGFRHTLLPNQPQFTSSILGIYFWAVTILLLVSGSILHMKYRDRFVDFL